MKYQEIIENVRNGHTVHWKNVGYSVIIDKNGRVLLSYLDKNFIGLNEEAFKEYNESDFFFGFDCN